MISPQETNLLERTKSLLEKKKRRGKDSLINVWPKITFSGCMSDSRWEGYRRGKSETEKVFLYLIKFVLQSFLMEF